MEEITGIETNIESIPAKLYLCATPIGNMGDVTQRVLRTLEAADVIFCEDTRNSGAMLQRLGIRKRLESCHEHNEEAAAERIAELVLSGRAVAYISDAGMPCISDPGERLVRACIEKNVPFEVLPGASASLTAAILSGLPTKRIYFVGFLARENRERNETIAEIKRVTATVVLYESPYRVAATLGELLEKLGDRKAAVVREITKLYEEAARGTFSTLAEKYAENPPKGECVIVFSGENAETEAPAESLDDMLLRLIGGGMSVKDAAKQAALLLDIPKNEAYKRANELKNE
ncbi:MAG: 16S rRNA (cytidine(1402)-2'-O)-methyltransferase [Clostridiales bacterium]|nr:16S rRNA (cytidine(1402)-2'-O)-methyltransferase [Clostridiales bacterium]